MIQDFHFNVEVENKENSDPCRERREEMNEKELRNPKKMESCRITISLFVVIRPHHHDAMKNAENCVFCKLTSRVHRSCEKSSYLSAYENSPKSLSDFMNN